jgi:hypothetical protein
LILALPPTLYFSILAIVSFFKLFSFPLLITQLGIIPFYTIDYLFHSLFFNGKAAQNAFSLSPLSHSTSISPPFFISRSLFLTFSIFHFFSSFSLLCKLFIYSIPLYQYPIIYTITLIFFSLSYIYTIN